MTKLSSDERQKRFEELDFAKEYILKAYDFGDSIGISRENSLTGAIIDLKNMNVDITHYFPACATGPSTQLISLPDLALEEPISKSAPKTKKPRGPYKKKEEKVVITPVVMDEDFEDDDNFDENNLIVDPPLSDEIDMFTKEEIPPEDFTTVFLEPTELGKAFHCSAQMINKRLVELGYQIKDVNGKYIPTVKGHDYCTFNHFKTETGFEGRNLKWDLLHLSELASMKNTTSSN